MPAVSSAKAWQKRRASAVAASGFAMVPCRLPQLSQLLQESQG